MGFWGIEVKPGKSHPYHSDNDKGVLRITQATLGIGSSTEKSILQCSVGSQRSIFLCALLPNRNECCHLDLQFEDELVAFSVIGPRSIHLSGYILSDIGGSVGEEHDSDTIEETASAETEDSDCDSDYVDNAFVIDDGFEMHQSSPVHRSSVVIEEITEDKKHDKQKRLRNRLNNHEKSFAPPLQICKKPDTESEDEDGFPIPSSGKPNTEGKQNNLQSQRSKKPAKDITCRSDTALLKKRKDTTNLDGGSERDVDIRAGHLSGKDHPNMAKKNKRNKKKKSANNSVIIDTTKDGSVLLAEHGSNTFATSKKSRTFPNGLVIDELVMGKPDGKRASPGCQVWVNYIGMLKSGEIFDSNVDKKPFKFRLGVGQVIKGWDVGINGMRLGDKRRITVPPKMGYGAQGASEVVPPDSWLVFDVELVDVR